MLLLMWPGAHTITMPQAEHQRLPARRTLSARSRTSDWKKAQPGKAAAGGRAPATGATICRSGCSRPMGTPVPGGWVHGRLRGQQA